MRDFWKNLGLLACGLVLFIGISYVVRQHEAALQDVLGSSGLGVYGALLFVGIGIVTVMVPFGSILPFMPLAVSLWGWPVTALLTFIAWVLGSQIIFEFARLVGKPVVLRVAGREKLEQVESLVHSGGFLSAVFVRMVVHGDLVSYAFGIFTGISRWKFLAVTAIGVAPGAVAYAYLGSLPFAYQVGLTAVSVVAFALYWALRGRGTAPETIQPVT
jgi:uncharacterized membrane protein YdjX (TVP38/TMEM64 family)